MRLASSRAFLLFCLLCLGPVSAADAPTPMARYLDSVLSLCDGVEKKIPELTKLAEIVAERHVNGGTLGVIWEPPSATGPQGPQYEMRGRSGGMMAFDVSLPKKMAEASREKDVAIIGWQRAPGPKDLEILKKYHEKFFIIAFGPRALPAMADFIPLVDAWIDTGTGADDRLIDWKSGTKVGRSNTLLNVLNTWAFLGEVIAAETRRGKMPTMLKSHSWPDAKEWNGRYRQKLSFHDDITVPPIPAGTLSRRYLEQIRGLTRAFKATQQAAVDKAATLITAELAEGRKTLVAQTGHTTYESVGQYEDHVWATPIVLYDTPGRLRSWASETPEGAVILRVGYSGEDRKLIDLMRERKQRILLIASDKDPRPDFKIPTDLPGLIEMGWDFGDACVTVEGYPIRIFPPSGAMQLIAYESVNVEVLARLAATAPTASAPETAWPPPLPGAVKGTVTITSEDFLRVPEEVEKARGKEGAAPFTVAKTAPTVDLAFHGDLPDRAQNGTGWSSWGDIVVGRDGQVYTGIGNHGRNNQTSQNGGGHAFIYSWNPETKELKKIADLNKIAGAAEGDPTWSKVHAGIQEDGAGNIYFTGTLNDGGRSFQTAWTERMPGGQLFRYDPKSGASRIVATFPGEVTPTTLLDRKRNVWYGNFEGKTAAKDVALTAVDLETNKIIYHSANDDVVASRNLALARDGAVYFNGKGGLWKFDPATKTIEATQSTFPGALTMRSSTAETRDGAIYGSTMRPGLLFRYRPAQDKLEMLGPDFLTGDYTTVTALSPDEKYVYYLPGAHGGAAATGTPVVQYEIATGRRKVLAFLRTGIEKAANYTPAGTYGMKTSVDGSTLYVGFNGSPTTEPNPPKKQAKAFGLTAFAAIHIPPSER